MVLLVATKKLRYDGKELGPGDKFQASEKDAMILKAIDKASEVKEDKEHTPPRAVLPKKPAATLPPDPAPPVVAVTEVKQEPEPEVLPPAEPETAPVSTTSRYKRRDLHAVQE